MIFKLQTQPLTAGTWNLTVLISLYPINLNLFISIAACWTLKKYKQNTWMKFPNINPQSLSKGGRGSDADVIDKSDGFLKKKDFNFSQ